MGYIHIMAYSGLNPLPNVSVHPDGYIVDAKGNVVKRAICPIPGDMSNRIFDGLIPGAVYEFRNGMRLEMCTVEQRLNFMEALAEFAHYTPVSEPGKMFQRPYTKGANAKKGGRYWELITLTTNRAIVGPVVSNKLAKEFTEDIKKAQDFDLKYGFEDGFYKQFLYWGEVFSVAADNGLVSIY